VAATVPPFLWSESGDFDSPVEYTVPGSGEVQPYTATATYTNASGQAILPALRLKSQSGNLLALTFPQGETIADGSASEVTFVPPFGSAGSGGTSQATPAAYALVSRHGTALSLPDNAATAIPWLHFETSDQTVFSTLPNGASGDTELSLNANGLYLGEVAGHINGANGIPRYINIVCGPSDPAVRGNYPGNDTSLGALPSTSTTWEVDEHYTFVNGTPQIFTAFGFQQSGGNANLSGQTNMIVYYWPAPAGTVVY